MSSRPRRAPDHLAPRPQPTSSKRSGGDEQTLYVHGFIPAGMLVEVVLDAPSF